MEALGHLEPRPSLRVAHLTRAPLAFPLPVLTWEALAYPVAVALAQPTLAALLPFLQAVAATPLGGDRQEVAAPQLALAAHILAAAAAAGATMEAAEAVSVAVVVAARTSASTSQT